MSSMLSSSTRPGKMLSGSKGAVHSILSHRSAVKGGMHHVRPAHVVRISVAGSDASESHGTLGSATCRSLASSTGASRGGRWAIGSLDLHGAGDLLHRDRLVGQTIVDAFNVVRINDELLNNPEKNFSGSEGCLLCPR